MKTEKEKNGRTKRLGFAQHIARAGTILLYTKNGKCKKCVVQESCYQHGK